MDLIVYIGIPAIFIAVLFMAFYLGDKLKKEPAQAVGESLENIAQTYTDAIKPIERSIENANKGLTKILESHFREMEKGVERVRGKIRYPELRDDEMVYLREFSIEDARGKTITIDVIQDKSTGKQFFIGQDGGIVGR